MRRNSSGVRGAKDLRLRAEGTIRKKIDSAKEMSADEARRLAHELEVHQVELEMQNEELRRSQIELSESRKKYVDLYDFAPVGYFSIDKDGKIIEVNLKGTTLLGVARSQLMKVPFARYIVPEHRGIFMSYLLKMFEDGPDTCELKFIRKDGSWFFASVQGTAVTVDYSGGPAVQLSMVDITKRKEAEGALRESEQRYRRLSEEIARLLEQARQDVQTKTILLHEVNHRVKNNLASIIGLIQTQERFLKENGPPMFRSMCRDLTGRVQGLAVVHNLLSAAGWSLVKLTDLATEVIHSTLQILPYDQPVSARVSPSSILVTPDQASALALVINELATNTIKHGQKEKQAPIISVHMEEDEGRVLLEFRDNGPGYPESIHEERYNVGLHIVTNLVRRDLEGEVTFCNDHGAVTRIQFDHRDLEGGSGHFGETPVLQ